MRLSQSLKFNNSATHVLHFAKETHNFLLGGPVGARGRAGAGGGAARAWMTGGTLNDEESAEADMVVVYPGT